MGSLNIRISEVSHRVLQRLAREEGQPMQRVLDRAVEHYRRQKFLQDANRAFAALRKNKAAWAEEVKERKAWDRTLSDGLSEEW